MEPAPSVDWTNRVYAALGTRAMPASTVQPRLYHVPLINWLTVEVPLYGEIHACGSCLAPKVCTVAWAFLEREAVQFTCAECAPIVRAQLRPCRD